MPRSGSRVRVSFIAHEVQDTVLHFLSKREKFFDRDEAQVAELVDAYVSGAYAARCAGSSPVLGTRVIFEERAGGEIGIHATLRG